MGLTGMHLWIAIDATADSIEVTPTQNPLIVLMPMHCCKDVDPSSNMGDHGIDQYLVTLYLYKVQFNDVSPPLMFCTCNV